MRGQMPQESSARQCYSLQAFHYTVKWKDPYTKEIQAQPRWFQPLLMTEVGKRLCADTGSIPTCDMATNSVLLCSAAIFFPSVSPVAANTSEHRQDICHIVRCWWPSEWSVSFQTWLLLPGLLHFVRWSFSVHHLHLLSCWYQGLLVLRLIHCCCHLQRKPGYHVLHFFYLFFLKQWNLHT